MQWESEPAVPVKVVLLLAVFAICCVSPGAFCWLLYGWHVEEEVAPSDTRVWPRYHLTVTSICITPSAWLTTEGSGQTDRQSENPSVWLKYENSNKITQMHMLSPPLHTHTDSMSIANDLEPLPLSANFKTCYQRLVLSNRPTVSLCHVPLSLPWGDSLGWPQAHTLSGQHSFLDSTAGYSGGSYGYC